MFTAKAQNLNLRSIFFKSHYMNRKLRRETFFLSHTFAPRSFGLNTQGSSFPPTRHFLSVVMKLMMDGDLNDIKRFVGEKQNSDGLTCVATLHNKVRWGGTSAWTRVA